MNRLLSTPSALKIRPFQTKVFISQRKRLASCLVVSEHDQSVISPATLSTITAASKIGGEITLLITGKNLSNVTKHASSINGISKVLTYEPTTLNLNVAEDISTLLEQIVPKYTHILVPSTNHGKNYLPRLAALFDSAPMMDVLDVVDENTFKRPMYAGNAIATMKMSNPIKFLLIRPTAFEKASTTSSSTTATVELLSIDKVLEQSTLSSFISSEATISERPDLTAARVVISGGRGLKSAENFTLLDKLADKLGGAIGASRAAVDAGFAPNEYQVGQTGKVVAPDLYIAVGISGAIQHLSGMKDSKVIVAINKDKEAPIFQVSDYGLVDDLFKVVPEMTNKL